MIPEELSRDLEILKDRESVFEVIEADGKIYIFFKNFPLPSGIYNLETTDLIIFTVPSYPSAGFDMFWTSEELKLKNGNTPQQAEAIEPHLGKMWRRFSYHPYSSKPWNPSMDDVNSFMEYVMKRLRMGI
jgi:hypothetical protein